MESLSYSNTSNVVKFGPDAIKATSSHDRDASNNNVLESNSDFVEFRSLDNFDKCSTTDGNATEESAFDMKDLNKSLGSDDLSVKDKSQKISAKTVSELQSFSLSELKALAENLAKTVKEVSSELVHLLQENDMLQEESDARNIVIEQLLQLTVSQAETELRPVQMSVVIPSSSDDDWD